MHEALRSNPSTTKWRGEDEERRQKKRKGGSRKMKETGKRKDTRKGGRG